MLNELLIAERGLARAGVSMTPRHGDIQYVRKGLPTLLVRLDANGRVAEVRAVPAEARPWTLGDVNHNRFPFVQPKVPFWQVSPSDPARVAIGGRDVSARRTAILSLADRMQPDGSAAADLVGAKFEKRLQDRSKALSHDPTNVFAFRVAEAMRRFEKAAGQSADHARFAQALSAAIVQAMRDSGDDKLTAIATGLLVGRFDEKKKKVVAEAGLLFDATPDSAGNDVYPLWHPDVAAAVSDAMSHDADPATDSGAKSTCALRGTAEPLLSGPFPHPNLPIIGPTFFFSRNPDTPSLARYGEYEATMPVARSTAETLQAAAMALTLPEREGKTWRSIPGERPTQTDLLLAYVVAAPDAPVAEVVTSERDLEQLAKELVEAIKSKVGDAELARTPVRLTVLRRVDPGNHKAIASDTLSVARLESAAKDWHAARRLLPLGLMLPVPEKKKVVDLAPPNVAPLGLIGFTRPVFIRGGTERTDAVGITAAEALALFLDEGSAAAPRARRVLHFVLRRRSALVVGCAHARRRTFEDLAKFDRFEALRTVTVLCVLLHKLGLRKDKEMTTSPAYKLGQLLAAADAIHAGYCADVRGGQLPPSLLGNQVFAAAQKSPVAALEILSRRWKPYGAWARPSGDARDRAEQRINSKLKKDQQRGWDMRVALRHARDWKPLAAELAEVLPTIRTDDVYRAELLLGYLAGLPKRPHDDVDPEPAINEGNVA